MTSPPDVRRHGRCLCGTVRLELRGPLDFVAHCHCGSCRRAHAAAYVTWTSVPRERFSIPSGEPELRWYRSSPTIEWGFCGRCGTSMLYRAEAAGHPEAPRPGAMYVAVGCLEDVEGIAPGAHVSFEEHAPWADVSADLPRYRGKGDEPMD